MVPVPACCPRPGLYYALHVNIVQESAAGVKPLSRSQGMAALAGRFCWQRGRFNREASIKPVALDFEALHSVTFGAAAARKGVAGFIAILAADIPHGEWDDPQFICMTKPLREAFPRLREAFPAGNGPFPTVQKRREAGNERRRRGNASEKGRREAFPVGARFSPQGMGGGRWGKRA